MGNPLGGKDSAPSPPNFTQAAEKQAQSGQQAINTQTQANRPDQTNAFGFGSNWTQGPGGAWTQTSTAGGPLGSAIGGLEGQIAGQRPLGTGDQARDQAINATYGQMASRLDPQWSQRDQQERSMLANQGLDPGSEAYNNEMGNFNRARNDAYQGAANNAITQGLQAQQTTFGQNLASQMAPYQQLGSLAGLSGQQGFMGAGAAQGTQYLPALMAQYQGQLNKFGADQAGKNSAMGGIGSLAGMAGAL